MFVVYLVRSELIGSGTMLGDLLEFAVERGNKLLPVFGSLFVAFHRRKASKICHVYSNGTSETRFERE